MAEEPAVESSTFSSLVLSMAAAALAGLGRAVVPGAEKPEVNLPLARQSIDTLAMLKTKTEGNRTEEETRLLDELLTELKLLYVKTESGQQPASGASGPR